MQPHQSYSITAAIIVVVFLLVLLVVVGRTAAGSSRSSPSHTPMVELSVNPSPPLYSGDIVTLSASTDPAAPESRYQFRWELGVLQPWSEASSCRWVLPDATGEHRVTVEVHLPDGTTVDTTKTVYIYRRPVAPSDHDPSAH